MKKFVFLYPIPEFIESSIKTESWHFPDNGKSFREHYKKALNSSISLRYRQKGFEIVYANFFSHSISDVVNVLPADRIIDVGIDFATHTTKRSDGTYLYPDENYILDKIGKAKKIIVAGFHMWDCVERLARRAYEKGIETLVDEDLTEFLPSRIQDPFFRLDIYPSFNPKKMCNGFFDEFMSARKERPWLLQKY